jgi:DNA modification methylase
MSRLHKKTIYEALGRGPVHPFPARMAPGIALDIISRCRTSLRVLDPMMGSGTVVALARANGHRVSGSDIDPLAVLISKVWTTAIDHSAARKSAAAALKRARKLFKTLSLNEAYPVSADRDTRKFIRYWFDGYVRRQLAALAMTIKRVRDENIRNALWCAFSRLIITKQAGVSLAKDLAHSRPHRCFEVAPIKPFGNFMRAVDRVLENCLPDAGKNRGPVPRIELGDARKLGVPDSSVDLVLTSPPYLNAIDYIRCSKFSLVWMGFSASDLRSIRSRSIGTEVGQYEATEMSTRIIKKLKLNARLSSRHNAVLTRFVEDMIGALREVSRVLVPGGKAIYVIGENTIRGVYIHNSKLIGAAAVEAGLVLHGRTTRALPPNRRYLPPPTMRAGTAPLDARMRREVILWFTKPSVRAPRRVRRSDL